MIFHSSLHGIVCWGKKRSECTYNMAISSCLSQPYTFLPTPLPAHVLSLPLPLSTSSSSSCTLCNIHQLISQHYGGFQTLSIAVLELQNSTKGLKTQRLRINAVSLKVWNIVFTNFCSRNIDCVSSLNKRLIMTFIYTVQNIWCAPRRELVNERHQSFAKSQAKLYMLLQLLLQR